MLVLLLALLASPASARTAPPEPPRRPPMDVLYRASPVPLPPIRPVEMPRSFWLTPYYYPPTPALLED